MRIAGFIISTTFLIALIVVLDSSETLSWLISKSKGKEVFVPSLGKLLSPSCGFWRNAEPKSGPNLRNFRNPALKEAVTIIYDDRLVPHIFAKNEKDAFFAQGYVTAALRLWQMEFQTHAISGRLCEFLGTTAERRSLLSEIDRKRRKQGLHIAAKKSVELWKKNPETYALLESYTAGINAYINSLTFDKYPLEYKLLNYKPEQWSVYKSALLLKAMADDLVSKDLDFEMTNAYKYFGKEKFRQLYPEYFQEQIPVITDSSAYRFEAVKLAKDTIIEPYTGYTGFDPEEKKPKGIGSNNWAVGPKKSASGKPILCNDPHLGLNLPSIWFEIQIECPEFNAYGASLPGAPGVISGFNKFIAWGVTNVAHDVKDWYAVKWTDTSKKFYYVDDKKMPVKIIYDTIKIRGKAPLIDTLRYTHLGPVAKNVNGTDFVLYWLANEPGHEPLTFLKLMRGKNYNDYLDAIQNFGCPAQNLVFASNNGDIALWTQGKLPIRRPEQGKFVMDGSISFNQYEGFIPQNQIPHEYNPKKGFVESANQHSVRPDYPYYTYGYFEEYRGRYLHMQLASSQNVKAEEMQLLQKSNYGQKAADFLPHMIKYLKKGSLSKEELELLAKLKNWNYQYLAAEIAPAIFEDWFYNFNEAVYDEIKHAQSKGIDLVYPDEWHLLNLIKRDTGNIIFDKINTENKEDLSEILTSSFKTTGKTIPRKDNKVLTWGEMKSTALMHLARIKEFGIFNLNVDGSYHALNAVSNRYDFEASRKKGNSVHKEKSSSGPSWKMVVEMSDVPKASTIYPGGQSGNPGSHYYSNMVNDWASGKYYDAWYMLSPDESNKKAILTQKIYN